MDSVNLGHHSSGPGRAEYDSTGTADINPDDLIVLSNCVLVKPDVEEVSKGGIVIADVGDAQKVRWGTVVGVGPGRYEDGVFVKTTIEKGDRVMFGKYQSPGEAIKLGGVLHLTFREGDLIARTKRY